MWYIFGIVIVLILLATVGVWMTIGLAVVAWIILSLLNAAVEYYD